MGLTKTLMVAGTGAALAYFFDPVSGRERREKLRQYWQERMQGGAGVATSDDEVAPPIVVPQQPKPRSTSG